ncbi:3-deoxy-7-phosphoheptulonate synthase [Sporolactobacillus shoreae]|uniref:3-deoxy-7-phosphoheptulonate synthase n=1 Tax=Sporolactobacillus shoreae TaxID=1465501 RepID=A0A4Z0GRZ6_9BACL|nr:3-deoxy-7-phosphoheptulonate synthase [Sporolactobacillus shoreae]TGA99425.1 3-deoxy-7-phosphoheptulonate synthase [Sporolactobacillus shoreae]
MIIQFRQPNTEIIGELKEKFERMPKQVFSTETHMAVVGLDHYNFTARESAAISKVIPETPSYVQGSRTFHPKDTIIRLPHTQIGGKNFTLMAGPCSVESEEHVQRMAAVAREGGATVLRGGAFKPRTSPYSFQGLGEKGLRFLREAADENGMDVITEVMDESHVPLVAQYTDVFQIGARNMQNFSLLKAVGKTQIPVALKRGMSGTVDDLLNASEYIASGGNHNIMLIERGIRTFDNKYTRNTFDLAAVPVLQKLTHYPVIVDPSHAVGVWDLVAPMAYAGAASGASGMIVEIHDAPDHAFSDGPQALKPDTYLKMAQHVFDLRRLMDAWEG